MSTASGAVPGIAIPTAWMIRPQFGSPPYSAVLTSGESATARATRSTTRHRRRRARRRGRRGGRPRRHGRRCSASCRSSGVERLAEAQLILGLGLDRDPDAPLHWRITVSLVDSWPSTLTRSNERLTVTPSSRSQVSGGHRRVGLDEHSSVAKPARSSRPFACAVRRTVPPLSATSRQARLSNTSVVRIASAKSTSPSGRSSCAAASDSRASPSPSAAARRSRRSRRPRPRPLGRALAMRRRALHLGGVRRARAAGGGVRVAGVDDDRADAVRASRAPGSGAPAPTACPRP